MRPLHNLSPSEIREVVRRAAQSVTELGPDMTHAVELDAAASDPAHPDHDQTIIEAVGGTWVRAWVFVAD